jgi:alkanesulfonate monooxygenase SsuD/methylene tetrahydromethanopterin reductase-like flavin-dependent oxidoreductase (luciferase family)
VLPPKNPSQLADVAAAAEELGYDRFWVADQTFHADPFLLLDDCARYSSIPLGLAVTSPFARHPVQLARGMVTLMHLHPAKAWIFALGTANPQHVLSPLGLRLREAPRQLRVALQAIRELASGRRVTVDDPELDFKMHGVSLEMDPVEDIQLYIGTRGPKILEHAAGRAADGVIVEAQFTPEGIAWARELLDRGSAKVGAGRHFAGPYISWQVVEILEEGEEMSERARDFGAMLMASTARATLHRMHIPIEIADTVKSGRKPSSSTPTTHVAKFVAAGNSEHLIKVIRSAKAAGVDAWASVFTGHQKEALRQMKLFARDLMPKVRAA